MASPGWSECVLQSNPPILTQVWLSTFAEVTADPFGAIWFRPADYREVVKGTPFAVEPHRKQQEYQRQTARELFVEKKIRKISQNPCSKCHLVAYSKQHSQGGPGGAVMANFPSLNYTEETQ